MNRLHYPEYKTSSVEWLGDVPGHWVETRIKNVASIRVSNVDKKSVEGQESVRLCNYVDVYYHDRITPDLEFMEATATPQQVEKFALKKGDVLITKDSETPDDIAVPSIVGNDLDGVVCGYHLALIRPDVSAVDGAYLARLLSALGVRDQFYSLANGITRFGLSTSDISCASIVVPPINEQHVIAAFLDREMARIDALIEKKQRFIGLLQEKRAALIGCAVTRGLNPNVPLKDSGVEWLGQIPAHWEVMPLKRELSFVTSGSRGWAGHYSDEGKIFIRIGNLTRDSITLDLSDVQYVDVQDGTEGERTRIKDGDLLISITAYLGSVAVAPDNLGEAYVSQHVALARPTQIRAMPRWLGYMLLSFVGKAQLEMQGYGGTKVQLGLEDIRSLLMLVPQKDEQQEIVDYLDRETAKLDALRTKVESAIETLKEYRAALIAAAVTGKIDVRAA